MHFSHTRLTMYQRCPAQYKFRYVDGLRRPSGAMLVLGSAYHEAHETNFKQKIDSRQDMPAKEVKEIFADAFDRRRENDDIDWKDEQPGELKDQGVAITAIYHKHISPTVQPKLVEEKLEIAFENVDYSFTVIPDVFTEEHRLIDLKTSKRAMPKPNGDSQAAAQWLACRHSLGIEPAGFRYDAAIKTKKPYIQQLEVPVTEDFLTWYLWSIGAIADAISAGIFPPTSPANWWCSESFCGYFELCRKPKPKKERA